MVHEGAVVPLPATLSETPWSEGSKNYIRNVEAEASSPFTSTKESPGQRTEGGIPRKDTRPEKGCRDLIGLAELGRLYFKAAPRFP
jgi:hypothetical protein